MKHGLVSGLALLFCLGAPSWVAGAETEELLAILSKIKERQDSYNPCLVRYRLKTRHTKYFFGALRKIEPADKKLWDQLPEWSGVSRCEYAQKGGKLYQKSFGLPLTKPDLRPGQEEESIFAYDGKLTRETVTGKKVVAISRKRPVMLNPLSDFNREKMLLYIPGILKAGKHKLTTIRITRSANKVPGAVVHLHLVWDNNVSSLDVWLTSEEKGYCVLRLENRMDGTLAHESTDCQYTQVDGIFFPRQATANSYSKAGPLHSSERYEADSITCRADQIPDSLFEVATPAGTELLDRDMKDLRLTDPAEVEKHIQEAAEQAGKPPSAAWGKWLYFAGSVFFLAAFAAVTFLVFRARRRKAGPAGG